MTLESTSGEAEKNRFTIIDNSLEHVRFPQRQNRDAEDCHDQTDEESDDPAACARVRQKFGFAGRSDRAPNEHASTDENE